MTKAKLYRKATIELLKAVEECYGHAKRCKCYSTVERVLRRLVKELLLSKSQERGR